MNMNQPWVCLCPTILKSPQPSSPLHPSELCLNTSFECPASCIEFALVIYFTYGNKHFSIPFISFNCFTSVQFNCSVLSDYLRPHESQHARPPCPSLNPGVHSNSCPLGRWCHPAISSSVIPFSSCPQSLPASGSFPMSQLFAWGDQSTEVSASASVLPMNTQDWSPLGWTGWISL